MKFALLKYIWAVARHVCCYDAVVQLNEMCMAVRLPVTLLPCIQSSTAKMALHQDTLVGWDPPQRQALIPARCWLSHAVKC